MLDKYYYMCYNPFDNEERIELLEPKIRLNIENQISRFQIPDFRIPDYLAAAEPERRIITKLI